MTWWAKNMISFKILLVSGFLTFIFYMVMDAQTKAIIF